MTAGSLIDLIGRIHDEFERRGWRDSGNTARGLATALTAGLSPGNAAARVPNRFLINNDITTDLVEGALQRVLDETPRPVRIPRPVVTPAAPVSLPKVRRPRFSGAMPDVDQPPVPHSGHKKAFIAARVSAAAIILIAAAIAVFVVPDAITWTWLLNHPARLSLEWGAFAVALLLAGGVVFWRWEFFGAAVVAAILTVIPLLGH